MSNNKNSKGSHSSKEKCVGGGEGGLSGCGVNCPLKSKLYGTADEQLTYRNRVEESIEESIVQLTKTRGHLKSICPSEVCRKIFPVTCWRSHMPLVREVGFCLAEEGVIVVSQRNKIIPPVNFPNIVGPIRFKVASPEEREREEQ